MKRSFYRVAVLAVTLLTVAGCGSSGGSGSTGATGTVGGANGQLLAADGSPIAGASVSISSASNTSNLVKTAKLRDAHGRILKNLPLLTDDEGETCADLSGVDGTVYASDCTGTDGQYSLGGDSVEIPCGETVVFSAVKGSFSMSFQITLTCSDDDSNAVALEDFEFSDDCGIDTESGDEEDVADDSSDSSDDSVDDSSDSEELSLISKPRYTVDDASCDFNAANIAVVTGYYDEIENVLAKLGYGAIDSSGVLDQSQEFDFDLIDGTGSLDDDTFQNFDEFLQGDLSAYDIIFINCGNSDESLAATNSEVLQEYVNNGGTLYVTDWSYEFIENPFPEFMDYLNGGSDPAVVETDDAAKVGTSGISSDATVNDEEMSEWLSNVTVNDGDIESDCNGEVPQKTGALNEDGTITIADFLSGWVVMEGVHSGVEEEPTIWISGPITYSGGTAEDAPLTVTEEFGDGQVLYSSYHTAHSCPTTGFWPQERVLNYLVFEL